MTKTINYPQEANKILSSYQTESDVNKVWHGRKCLRHLLSEGFVTVVEHDRRGRPAKIELTTRGHEFLKVGGFEAYPKTDYRVGEVSRMLNLPVSTITYWTKTFETLEHLRSNFGKSAHYLFEDIEMIKRIKRMLHDNGLSIDAVRSRLTPKLQKSVCKSSEDAIKLLDEACDMSFDNPSVVEVLETVKRWIEKTTR